MENLTKRVSMQSQHLKKASWEKKLNQIKLILWLLLIAVIVAAIAIVDHRLSFRISFSLLYLIPIALASIRFRLRTCFIVMVLTIGVGLAVDLIRSEQFQWVLTPYVNAALRSIAYVFLILIQDRLKTEATNARMDSLTGLLNRRAFWEITEEEVERCKRHNRPVSIAYIDVDDFKLVNDRYGHRTGDRFLLTLSKTLNKGSRVTDKVARVGGDEFAILMPETGEEGAKTVLDRLSKLTQVMNQHLFSITVSIGIVTFLKAPVNAEAMISEADRLMYLGKKNGKNRIETHTVR